jgi:hypothetical protein
MMNNFTRWFDDLLDSIQSLLMSVLVKIGPFFVALMPALFMSYAIYSTFKVDAGIELAFSFAVVVGVAWETVGIVATHTATDLYNAMQKGTVQPVKFWLMVGLVPVYVLGVAGVVGFSQDAFTPLVKGLGVASPFLTAIVYIAVALARDLANISQEESQHSQHKSDLERIELEHSWQAEREERAHKRALELRQAEASERERLRELELNAKVRIVEAKVEAQRPQELVIPPALLASNQHKPAEDSLECEDCHRLFGTRQAMAAHKRFCEGVNKLEQAGQIRRNNGWQVNGSVGR